MNADPEKLARVFSNLLRNAASYSYPQTEITISAKRLEHDIQITFENHGKTIPQEQLNSIFEKFNRLDDARLSNTGGAGLGLSRCGTWSFYCGRNYTFTWWKDYCIQSKRNHRLCDYITPFRLGK